MASGLPFAWTSRICWRPLRSGRSTTICRSKRPGRSSAGSRMSGRFVAAIRMMLSFGSNPSISTRSWLSVCSRSSWPPPRPAPRWRPTASISSMKMMHGPPSSPARTGRGRARRPRRRTSRRSPSRRSRRTARPPRRRPRARAASCRCPAARTAARPSGSAAQRLELLRGLEEVLDLLQLLDGLVHAGHVLEGDLGRVGGHPLRAALAEAHHLLAAALHLVHQEDPEADQEDEREEAVRIAHHALVPMPFESYVTLLSWRTFSYATWDSGRRGS